MYTGAGLIVPEIQEDGKVLLDFRNLVMVLNFRRKSSFILVSISSCQLFAARYDLCIHLFCFDFYAELFSTWFHFQVRVDMGQPILKASDVPTKLTANKDQAAVKAKLDVDGLIWNVTCVSMGNPHCVTFGAESCNVCSICNSSLIVWAIRKNDVVISFLIVNTGSASG